MTQNPNKCFKSPIFREFQKYLSKNRTYAKKTPDLKKLLLCKEYKECDTKKEATIEVREWTIPMGNNEERGLKFLLFMIAKHSPEKRLQDLKSFNEPQKQIVGTSD